jgi:transcriptional regulator with XRE-family HTH domain
MTQGSDTRPRSVGERILELRALRAYSLRELATRAHVSKTMLSNIEQGHRQPSEQVVAAIARALSVSVSVLHGQPYMEQLRKDQLDRLISPLSSALDCWGVPPADDDPPPRGVPDLLTEVGRVRDLRSAGDFATLAEMLPSLLAECEHSAQVHTGHDRELSHWALAEAALGVFTVSFKLGYMDLARLSLARMASAALASGDPRQVAAERVKRAMLTTDGPAMEQGLRLVKQGLRDLDDDGSPATRAVRGGLILKGLQLNGLLGRGDEANTWLTEAEGIAAETGETDHYAFVFGPTNVAQHAVAAFGDRDEHGEALRRARKVHLPAGFNPLRAGVYWIDRARSEALTAHHDEALESLYAARKATPHQTRYHPTTRETVGVLLRARPRASDRLREYALWSGV